MSIATGTPLNMPLNNIMLGMNTPTMMSTGMLGTPRSIFTQQSATKTSDTKRAAQHDQEQERGQEQGRDGKENEPDLSNFKQLLPKLGGDDDDNGASKGESASRLRLECVSFRTKTYDSD